MIARAAVVVAALLVGGCPESSSVECGDGRICPAGTLCVAGLAGCYEPGQATVCASVPDGQVCMWDQAQGVCTEGFCVAPRCGNGILEAGETCEDTDAASGDGCSATCQIERCGNAILDPAEDCDCGDATVPDDVVAAVCNGMRNSADEGLCDPRCTLLCGNNFVESPEQCDNQPPSGLDCADVGFDDGPLACSQFCTIDTSACEVIGLRAEASTTTGDIAALWGAGDRVIALDYYDQLVWRIAGEWQSPEFLLSGVALKDVHGAAADDVMVVGSDGTAAHWDGAQWNYTFTETTEQLDAVWMPAPGRAVAVGSGTVLRWSEADGWAPLAFPGSDPLIAVFADGDEIFAASRNGVVWHQVASGAFTSTPIPGTLHAMHGTSASDVWVVGDPGVVAHWDGATWTTEIVPTTAALFDVWVDADEVMVVGAEGLVIHRDEHGWKKLARVASSDILAIGGARADDLVLGGPIGALWSYRGQSWVDTDVGTTMPLSGMWYTPGHGIVVGGDDGLVIQEDRGAFTILPVAQVQTGPFLRTIDAREIYAPAFDHIYAAGTGASPLGLWDGVAWTSFDDGLEPRHGLWGTELDRFWSAGLDVKYWDGVEWQQEPSADGLHTGLWGISNQQLAVVGDFGLSYSTPANGWEIAGKLGSPYRAVWMDANGRIWVVGDGALIDAPLEGELPLPPVAPANLLGVHGDAPDDVWAVGTGGTMARYDGVSWFQVRTPTFVDLEDVWVTPTMVYATGAEGVVLRLVRSTP